jgi:hypothetical protein
VSLIVTGILPQFSGLKLGAITQLLAAGTSIYRKHYGAVIRAVWVTNRPCYSHIAKQQQPEKIPGAAVSV